MHGCFRNVANDPSRIYVLLGANDVNDNTNFHRQTFVPTKVIFAILFLFDRN